MVLESLIKPLTAEKRPWEMFFYAILVSSIALFLGFWIFREEADLVAVFFTVFACIPVMFHAIRIEEKKDMLIEKESALLKEHSKVIAFFLFLFLGMVVSFSCWYVFLPNDLSQQLFHQQLDTITEINAPAGHAASFGFFSKIFLNNMKVLSFCILFAFFYGAGAIFILTWNATVIAAAIGSLAKGLAATNHLALSGGFALSRYLFHGLPEMLGYMVAGLAGGIISAAVINHHYKSAKFQKIMFDAATLLIIAIVILFIAAAMETFLTPTLFS
ncbi:MAG: stage II sporulation protein M [Nanoarchaeota archaeon]|nr:stage II sporulation protein M [Nanoarchaeota archaeon]